GWVHRGDQDLEWSGKAPSGGRAARRRSFGEGNQDLRGTRFSGAQLVGVDFSEADLRGAHFDGANLEGARFEYANLEGATLLGGDLYSASFFAANLEGANL